MDMTGTTVSAYNDLFGNEVYVECGRCGLATGTGSSGPTLAEVVEAAEHECLQRTVDKNALCAQGMDACRAVRGSACGCALSDMTRAYVVNDGSGSYGPEDGA